MNFKPWPKAGSTKSGGCLAVSVFGIWRLEVGRFRQRIFFCVALKQSASILKHNLDVFDRVSEEHFEFESQQSTVSEEENKLRKLLNMSVNEIELSVRAANCLNNANITTVGELSMKTEQEMLKYRNFGKKSLNEIKEKLEALGLSLGMKFDERLLDSKKEA